MNISINIGYILKNYLADETRTYLEAGLLCKEAGFDAVDCSPKVFLYDDWEKRANELAEEFSKNGIVVNQSHAPFNRYGSYDKEAFSEYTRRSFEIASILGAKTIAFHADEYITADGEYDTATVIQKECENLKPYVELAKKRGLIIGVENLFEAKNSISRFRCCSIIEEVVDIIDYFNDPSVGCCFDFGHAGVAFGDEMTEKLKIVGKRLVATHVHDNFFSHDDHLYPFLGKVDWKAQAECLKEIGYNGDFTFEFVYGTMPKEVLPMFLKYIYSSGVSITKDLG